MVWDCSATIYRKEIYLTPGLQKIVSGKCSSLYGSLVGELVVGFDVAYRGNANAIVMFVVCGFNN